VRPSRHGLPKHLAPAALRDDLSRVIASQLAPEDRPAVVELVRATGASVDPFAELERPWALAWVARRGVAAPPVGFLVAWAVADELHLIHIATDPGFRRQGAGRALMTALLDRAAAAKSRLVLLEVRRSNRAAIRLYRAFGFAAIGVRRGYYLDGEDAIEMMLSLDPTTGVATSTPDEVDLVGAAR